MRNRVIPYSLKGFEVFLKVTVIRFGENNVLGTIYIDIYQFRWLVGGGGMLLTLQFSVIIHKIGKITRA